MRKENRLSRDGELGGRLIKGAAPYWPAKFTFRARDMLILNMCIIYMIQATKSHKKGAKL